MNEPQPSSFLYRNSQLFYQCSDWLDRQELRADFPVQALADAAL